MAYAIHFIVAELVTTLRVLTQPVKKPYEKSLFIWINNAYAFLLGASVSAAQLDSSARVDTCMPHGAGAFVGASASSAGRSASGRSASGQSGSCEELASAGLLQAAASWAVAHWGVGPSLTAGPAQRPASVPRSVLATSADGAVAWPPSHDDEPAGGGGRGRGQVCG